MEQWDGGTKCLLSSLWCIKALVELRVVLVVEQSSGGEE